MYVILLLLYCYSGKSSLVNEDDPPLMEKTESQNIGSYDEVQEDLELGDGNRVSRRLVAAVASDKAVMQGLAPSVLSKAGTPAWSSTGDPCAELWKGSTLLDI